MSVHHVHHIEDPLATTPPPQFAVLGFVPTPPLPKPSEAMTVLITLPPGSAGTPPHRHTGPAFGYVIEGEMIFELEGDPECVVHAGETFWEPGGDVIHYQDGNNLADATTLVRRDHVLCLWAADAHSGECGGVGRTPLPTRCSAVIRVDRGETMTMSVGLASGPRVPTSGSVPPTADQWAPAATASAWYGPRTGRPPRPPATDGCSRTWTLCAPTPAC